MASMRRTILRSMKRNKDRGMAKLFGVKSGNRHGRRQQAKQEKRQKQN